MNRRDFTRALLASAAVPLMPTPALAMAPTAAAIPTAATSWASHLTAMHGTCTPKMLSSVLSVDVATAQNLSRGLVARGVMTHGQTVGTASRVTAVLSKTSETQRSFRSRMKMFLDDIEEYDPRLENHPLEPPQSKE